MKRKHCFDSVGQWSASGDAAGDTGRGYPVREWNEGISSRGETVESPRGVASPLDGEEFSDGPGPAVLFEPARGRGRAKEDF